MGVAVAELNDNKCLLLFQLLLVVVVAVAVAFVFAVSQQRQTPSTRLPPSPVSLCSDACRLPSVVVVLTWQEGVLSRRRYSIKMNNSLFIVEQ